MCKICDMDAFDKKYYLTFWDIIKKSVLYCILFFIAIFSLILICYNNCKN